MVWKTLVAQQRTNAQLNSHTDMAGYRMVRGERFTHKPTVNLLCSRVLLHTVSDQLLHGQPVILAATLTQ